MNEKPRSERRSFSNHPDSPDTFEWVEDDTFRRLLEELRYDISLHIEAAERANPMDMPRVSHELSVAKGIRDVLKKLETKADEAAQARKRDEDLEDEEASQE